MVTTWKSTTDNSENGWVNIRGLSMVVDVRVATAEVIERELRSRARLDRKAAADLRAFRIALENSRNR